MRWSWTSQLLSSLKSKAKWQKQLRVHLEQVNYAGAGFSEARSTLIHSVAFFFKWPLPGSPLCWCRSNAPPLEQNLSCVAENEVSLRKLWMIACLYRQSCVCSATGKGFSTVPFSRGPRSLQPLSAQPLIDVLWALLWLTAIFICCQRQQPRSPERREQQGPGSEAGPHTGINK